MLFDDEKDIVFDGAGADASDDGSVSWDDVLGDSDLDISLDDTETDTQPASVRSDGLVEDADEFTLTTNEDGEVDEDDLKRILNEQNTKIKFENQAPDSGEIDLDADFQDDMPDEQGMPNDFDANDGELSQRSMPKKKSSGLTVALVGIVFVALVISGVYFGLNTFIGFGKNNSNNSMPPIQNVQDQTSDEQSVDEEAQLPEEQDMQQENIPVVNEEETDTLSSQDAQQEPKEEKKQVINVVATGRADPFLPIQKYLNMDSQREREYERMGIPKPPSEYGIIDEETTKLMTIAVSGIMYDETKPSAIITYDSNDYFVQKGDMLDNFRVVGITKNTVTIQLGNNTYTANIGEEFKITNNISGSAQYMTSQQGGGRHYYSVGRDGNSDDGKYVSENDVEVKAK